MTSSDSGSSGFVFLAFWLGVGFAGSEGREECGSGEGEGEGLRLLLWVGGFVFVVGLVVGRGWGEGGFAPAEGEWVFVLSPLERGVGSGREVGSVGGLEDARSCRVWALSKRSMMRSVIAC